METASYSGIELGGGCYSTNLQANILPGVLFALESYPHCLFDGWAKSIPGPEQVGRLTSFLAHETCGLDRKLSSP